MKHSQEGGKFTAHDLDLDYVKSVVDAFEKRNPQATVHLSGGEPLLYKDLKKAIEHAAGKDLRCEVTTNGSLLHNLDSHIEKLNAVNISLHSVDEEYYKYVTGTRKNFVAIVLDNIEKYRNRVDFQANCVYMADEKQDIEVLLGYCNERNILIKVMNDMGRDDAYFEGYLSKMEQLRQSFDFSFTDRRNPEGYPCHECPLNKNCVSCKSIWLLNSGEISSCPRLHDQNIYSVDATWGLEEKMDFAFRFYKTN